MDARHKLGAPGRFLLQQLESGRTPHTVPISLLIQGREAFSQEQVDLLTQTGAQVRTITGDIASLDVPASAIDRVLEHDFVVRGEVSTPLFPEAGTASTLDTSDVE